MPETTTRINQGNEGTSKYRLSYCDMMGRPIGGMHYLFKLQMTTKQPGESGMAGGAATGKKLPAAWSSTEASGHNGGCREEPHGSS